MSPPSLTLPFIIYTLSFIHQGVERPEHTGLRKLRTARVLDAGMYITVEPGCYFVSAVSRELFV